MLLMIFFIDGFVLNFSSPHFFSLMGLVIKQNIKELLFIMISLFLISIVVSDHSSLSNKGNNLVKVSSLFITYRWLLIGLMNKFFLLMLRIQLSINIIVKKILDTLGTLTLFSYY